MVIKNWNQHKLTKREAEVARWILLGKSSKEISLILLAAPRTIDAHVIAVRHKVGAKNRAHMATHLLLRDLVSITVDDLEEFG